MLSLMLCLFALLSFYLLSFCLFALLSCYLLFAFFCLCLFLLYFSFICNITKLKNLVGRQFLYYISNFYP